MRSAPVARPISTRTRVPHIDVYTVPIRLLSVGGNLTRTRSRRSNFPPPLRTASASISARYCSPPNWKRARDQAQREKLWVTAPVTKLRGFVPVGAELGFPIGKHRHPVSDLSLRRPCNVLRQERRLFLAECLERREGNEALGNTFVHEGEIVSQDGAIIVAPVRFHRRGIQSIERRLRAAAVCEHRAAPGFILGIVNKGPDNLRQGHRAVTDRLQQLIRRRAPAEPPSAPFQGGRGSAFRRHRKTGRGSLDAG